jgi:hypothetical protein
VIALMLARGLPSTSRVTISASWAGIFPRKAAGVDQVEPALGQLLRELVMLDAAQRGRDDLARWLARSSDYLVDISGSRLVGRGRRIR